MSWRISDGAKERIFRKFTLAFVPDNLAALNPNDARHFDSIWYQELQASHDLRKSGWRFGAPISWAHTTLTIFSDLIVNLLTVSPTPTPRYRLGGYVIFDNISAGRYEQFHDESDQILTRLPLPIYPINTHHINPCQSFQGTNVASFTTDNKYHFMVSSGRWTVLRVCYDSLHTHQRYFALQLQNQIIFRDLSGFSLV